MFSFFNSSRHDSIVYTFFLPCTLYLIFAISSSLSIIHIFPNNSFHFFITIVLLVIVWLLNKWVNTILWILLLLLILLISAAFPSLILDTISSFSFSLCIILKLQSWLIVTVSSNNNNEVVPGQFTALHFNWKVYLDLFLIL